MARRRKKRCGPLYLIDVKVLSVVLQVLEAINPSAKWRRLGYLTDAENRAYYTGYASGYQVGIRKNIKGVINGNETETTETSNTERSGYSDDTNNT